MKSTLCQKEGVQTGSDHCRLIIKSMGLCIGSVLIFLSVVLLMFYREVKFSHDTVSFVKSVLVC